MATSARPMRRDWVAIQNDSGIVSGRTSCETWLTMMSPAATRLAIPGLSGGEGT